MKILKWIGSNIFFIITIFLLAFIPLYPKFPILDVEHTWVYIRLEDFVITFVVLLWVALFLLKKVTFKTPLTVPIVLFWIAGGVSTLHGVLLIFPTLSDVSSNVAFLSLLRRIEYIFLFFIAFTGMKDKKFLPYIVAALVIVLLLVVGYGIGQKFYGWPAYLTMNEEFAKGIPIRLSELSRVPSTFAGHYDLAAYLVLIIPIFTSLAFGFKNIFLKTSLLATSFLGFVLLFMTVSRVSFVVLLMSLFVLLVLQKKRVVIVCLLLLTFVLLSFSPSLLERFGSTVTEIDVLVDAKTGGAIGHVKEVDSSYFKNRVVMRQHISREENKEASSSAILPYELIPEHAALIVESNSPTGENLPQGTSYINLPLSPVTKKVEQYFYQKSQEGTESAEIRVFYGDYLIKKAKAFDLSFTTRFQGEWPRTIEAFKRNIFLGSGYGSVSLAVDNNYLRILGELGLFGFVAFLSIFLIAGIYIKKILPNVDSSIARSFVLGFVAGTFGLILNAVLIDVFEASKIAFTYWILMGITLGLLRLHKSDDVDLYKELKKIIVSTYAVVIYLFIITVALYFSAYSYYFVGDDFTWFRWVTDCCNNAVKYFTQADGFFYRPGTKLYFSMMHSAFWLNQTMYHLVSLILHFSAAALLFLISKRILKNYFLSIGSAILFLILSGYHEAVFWISSTGFLFNAVFALLAILFFIYYKEKRKKIYFVISLTSIVLGLLFHELGVIVPLLIILYDFVTDGKLIPSARIISRPHFVLLSPILPYLLLRFIAGSHWFSGDYSYNLFLLPFNIVGNTIGYLGLVLFGPASLTAYQILRNISKEHVLLAALAIIIAIFIASIIYKMIFRKMVEEERRIVVFGLMFFIIALLPFLGLGNITSRYSYLATAGLAILLAYFLKKIYGYLSNINGRYIGLTTTTAIVIVYVALQLFQLQKIHTDWKVAGEKSKRFIISLEGMYINEWKKERMKFYFVNVPIRHGEAWVFPVGLSDAVWFVSRNQYISVYQLPSLLQAFNAIENPVNEKVFEFEGDGGVIEKIKPQRQ